jgi:hypothetical protein
VRQPLLSLPLRPSTPSGPNRSWTRKVQGKTVTRRLNDDELERYQPWFDNARLLRQLVAELVSLSSASPKRPRAGVIMNPVPDYIGDVEDRSM